jgi:hypothetical protein
MTMNGAAHFSFLHTKLMKLLSLNSFAHRMRRSIGTAIDHYFEPNEFDERGNCSYSRPVESLFFLITTENPLNLEWFAEEDGQYLDDSGELIPSTCTPGMTGVEQLAAYGLWFLDVECGTCGPTPEEHYDENGISPDGWREADVISHKAGCLLNAYQALLYAERLGHTVHLKKDEIERAKEIDFVAIRARADERRQSSQKALIAKYEPHRSAEKFVRDEWSLHKAAYDYNKSEFARAYVPRVKNEFVDKKGDPLTITEKQMKEVWLSDTPRTRKPARQRVGG